MVTFEKHPDSDYRRRFTATFDGDHDDYLFFMHALCTAIGCDSEIISHNERYYLSEVLRGLLPDRDDVKKMMEK